jgi:thymidine phosphorylase
VQLAAFVAACADDRLSLEETIYLTQAMVNSGKKFDWPQARVLDKHCVGGLPGNRTTPIVTAIIAANGVIMPKTSSRAITSPAGTADTMETMTPVSLSFEKMRTVVERHGACLAWGGSVSLSPIDDIIIRIERALDLDSEGQLVASVISKKVAAGSTHVLIDIPVGPSAKVRTHDGAEKLSHQLIATGNALGLSIETLISDGNQPVGRGIGPALEAHDVLAVLRNEKTAPQDLLERSLQLAARLLNMANIEGLNNLTACYQQAQATLASGQAYDKFIEICYAQGGFHEPGYAEFKQTLFAEDAGIVSYFNNRFIAKLASLAGAPNAPLAGITMHVRLGDKVEKGQALLTLHGQAQGELEYALQFYHSHPEAIQINKEIL